MAARAGDLLVGRLETLRSDVAQLADADPRRRRRGSIATAFDKIDTALEELIALEEELREQNLELAEVQGTLETERARYRDLFDLAPDGYIVTDPEGRVLEANQAAAELLNISQRFLSRLPLAAAITPEGQLSFRTAFVRQLASDEIGEWEGRLRPRRRPPLDVVARAATVRDSEGRSVALRWLLRDVTERGRLAAERAHAARARG